MTLPAPLADGVKPEPLRMAAAVELSKGVDAPQVRVVAAGAPETAAVAFTAQLTPLVAPERTSAEAEHRLERLIFESAPALPGDGDDALTLKTPPPGEANATATASQEPLRAGVARLRWEEPSQQTPNEQPSAIPNRAGPHPQSTVQPNPEAAPTTDRSASQPEPAGRTQPEAAPELPKTSTPAREIRLALGGGEQRVEVKVSDRGGEVQVAVRTIDGHLAGQLRENLPALTSRLAESGIRAETWHPPASGGGDWQQTKEISTANPADSSDPQPQQEGREQNRDREQQRQRTAEETNQRKEKGKDFTWLMSTLP